MAEPNRVPEMFDIKEFLAMSEEEKIKSIYYKDIPSYCIALAINKRWGDLAFRLRDEAVAKNSRAFHNAIYEVMLIVVGDDQWATAYWGECYSKPEHWIAAALAAKETKSNET